MNVIRIAAAALVGLAVASAAWSEELPDDARHIVAVHEARAEEIRQQAEKEIEARKAALVKELEVLQENAARAGRLDDALAIRERVRKLKAPPIGVGRKVEVEWHGTWWSAEVVEAKPDQWLIRYIGYSDQWNEWVGKDRIRLPSAAALAK